MMRILSVDTSEPVGSVAVSIGGKTTVASSFGRSSSHLVELGRAVDTLLKRARITIQDIDRIAVVTGPGSFTGLRIGMAYVKGLYAAITPEIVVMTSLELLAVRASEGDLPVSPMIDARKNEVYAALYQLSAMQRTSDLRVDVASGGSAPRVIGISGSGGRILDERVPPRALSPMEHIGSLDVRPTVFVGSGALRYADDITSVFGGSAVFPAERVHRGDPRLLCEIAKELNPLLPEDVVALEPFYIRPSDATLKPLKSIRTHDRH